MSSIKICDRCGKKIDEGPCSIMEYRQIGGVGLPKLGFNAFDICEGCRKDFDDFMAKKTPSVNARWIKTFVTQPFPELLTRAVCSNCNHMYGNQAFEFKRCPDCGAVMDLGGVKE